MTVQHRLPLVRCLINPVLGSMDALVGVRVWKFWRNDFTNDVNLSGTNTLFYLGLVRGEIYHPSYTSGTFRPRVDMLSYLVYYR